MDTYLAVFMIHFSLALTNQDCTRYFQETMSSLQCTTTQRDIMDGEALVKSVTSNMRDVAS